jgi:enoyl-CoA hydratase
VGIRVEALAGAAEVDAGNEATPSASLIVIDRAERRNALDVEHCQLLGTAVEASVAQGDRAIVLTGDGTSFCSGADFDAVASPDFRDALYAMLGTITAAPVPVVAAINGHAIGAGLQLAIATDLRIAAGTATFGVPTARLGLAVDPWTIERLVAVAGGGVARRLLLTCTSIATAEALVAGLVDRVGTVDDAIALALDLATMAPLTLRYIKHAIDSIDSGATAGMMANDASVVAAFEACWSSEDLREGLAARIDKRPARFEGR